MLYLIQSLDYYKIGYTSNLKSRMDAYKTMNPHVILLGVKEGKALKVSFEIVEE